MKKMAIFVEGATEMFFAERLVEEIAGKNAIVIEKREIRGGTNARRTTALVSASSPYTGQEFFVLIYDCGSDNAVKTRIIEEYDNLSRSGYVSIVGIRD